MHPTGETPKKHLMFLDVETTGFPLKRYNNYYHPSDFTKYDSSRIIEIAYIIDNKTVNELINVDVTIPNSHIHGITNDMTKAGKSLLDVLKMLNADLENTDKIVCHNIAFDCYVLMAECYRANLSNIADKIDITPKYCTMEGGQHFYNMHRWIKLTDLYFRLYGQKINQHHRALSDAQICKLCYHKLV